MKIPALQLTSALAAMASAVPGLLYATEPVSDADRALLDYRIEVIARNRPGTVSTDFRFIDRRGQSRTLHSAINPSARYILLSFFDPDCRECHQLANHLAKTPRISEAVTSGTLQIIFITPIDTDPELWQTYASTLPCSWTVGYSPAGEIDADVLYTLPSIPTLYLLSPDSTILIRNLHLAETEFP